MGQLRITLSLFVIAASCATAAPAYSLPKSSQLPFAKAQQMVDIGGRRLNLYCSGKGAVTVVFDAHSGGAASSWFEVQPAVAQFARACVYDRAGMGFSDPSPRPGTAANAVDDLHKLLGAAHIAPPYILVGSSFGGGNAQLYAWRYRADVKGMVLVEPQHEDDTERLDKITGGKMKQMEAMQEQMLKACVAQAVKGFVRGSELWNTCVGKPPANRSRALAASQTALRSTATYWTANASENANFVEGNKVLRAARTPLGDMPLIVLSRGVSPYAIPGQPQSALNKAVEERNQATLAEIAALSTRGSLRKIDGAGHVIHEDKPQAVVQAIKEMVEIVTK